MLDPAGFRTDMVRRAYEYWAGKAAGGRLPQRSDIRPEELRGLLPYIFLVDVSREPLAFRFRLVGTEITEWAEKEYTGLAISESDYGSQWKRVFDIYAGVVITRMPRHDIYAAPWVSREFLHYERLIAPLLGERGEVEMLFGALHALPSAPDERR